MNEPEYIYIDSDEKREKTCWRGWRDVMTFVNEWRKLPVAKDCENVRGAPLLRFMQENTLPRSHSISDERQVMNT
jgi:hypothetical protein